MAKTELKNCVITIDGSVGAGKSTAAKGIAKELGYFHLNSGALYRTIGFLTLGNEDLAKKLVHEIEFTFIKDKDGESVHLVNGMPLPEGLYTEECGTAATVVAKLEEVRTKLTTVQRTAREHFNLILEGRDSGSVVFPDANIKFYLYADSETRARRRADELGVDLQKIHEQILARDSSNQTREIAPEVIPDDAIVIDTTNLTVAEVRKEILNIIATKNIELNK